MKSIYYSALARLRLIPERRAFSSARQIFSKVPIVRSIGRQTVSLGKKVFFRKDSNVWVSVEKGFAKGVQLRLNLLTESNYWLGRHEVEVQEILKRLAKPGRIFYDLGAHLGVFSLAFAKSTGSQGEVFAFEPDPENALRVKEHINRNNFTDRVKPVEAAVWSCPTAKIPFKQGAVRRTYGGVCTDGITPVLADGETVMVPAISLDSFIQEGHPPPDILKIDVEGGECEVLKGGEKLFSASKPILICEVHYEGTARWITDWLVTKGYFGRWRIPKELFPRLLVAEAAANSGARLSSGTPGRTDVYL